MVQTSKPQRANTSMNEYSPRPGTVRSKLERDELDEPWTSTSTGRGASPGFGAPARLRHRLSLTAPFCAQYSALQIGSAAVVCVASAAGARPPAGAAAA